MFGLINLWPQRGHLQSDLKRMSFRGWTSGAPSDRYSAARSRGQRGPRQLQYPGWAARYLSKTSLAPSRVNVSPS